MNSIIESITSSTNQSELDLKTKKVQTTTFFRMLLLFGFLFIMQCMIAQPTITSFAPIKDTVGATVSVTGTGFNTTAANNVVFFGATRAIVNTATATNLTVTVPKGATYAPLTVLNTSTALAVYSTQFFNPIFSPKKDSFTISDIEPKVDFTTGPVPYFVGISDIDGDGKSDLITANYNSTYISVLRNTSTENTVSFATKVDFTVGTKPISLAIGDLDGDGKPDLAIVNQNSNNVSVLRNTCSSGVVSFANKLDYTTGISPISAAIGDIDGDGKLDLAITNSSSSSNTISIFRNLGSSGNISFDTKIDFATGSNPKTLAISDLDGDGKPDLAITCGNSYTVNILRNLSIKGAVSFATKLDFTTGTQPYSLAIGDLDGDGKPDLAITNSSVGSTSISILRNTGSSGAVSFATKVDFITNTAPVSIRIGDIDGDGKPDLVVGYNTFNNFSILRNIGSSGVLSFAPNVDFGSGSERHWTAIGDIDGDGKSDIVLANSGQNTVSVFLNNPKIPPTINSFTPKQGVVGTTVSITGTNFNTTASKNVVFFGATRATVTAATANSLTVTVPTGATFAPITVLNTATTLVAYSTQFFNPTFSPNKGSITTSDIGAKVDFGTGTLPCYIGIGDIDGDGKSDLAVVNGGNNTVSVLRNTGSSGLVSFATKLDFTTGTTPWSVAIGDIDGDAKPDLVIANYSSNTVSILRNTGSMGTLSFAVKVDFTTGTHPKLVTIGDLNGDGKPDLTIANDSSNTVSVLRNTGSRAFINFATKVDFATGSFPSSVAIGDMDGDGKPDLAIANSGNGIGNTVSLLRNTSKNDTVSFAIKVDFGTGTQPSSLALGDINGDGKLDLATANSNSNTVSVLRNSSSSGVLSFATKVDFTTGSNPRFVAMGDMDGDGKSDLAITNQESNTISILRNTSNGAAVSFTTKVDFTTNAQPNTLAISDIDGDGKPDLAVANQDSNTVSVLRNISSSTGVNETKANNNLNIYPNPFSETIHITLLNNLKLMKAIIYDMVGNEIIISNKNEIDASCLKSGIYLIMIVDNLGNIYNHKLIKN